MSESEFTLTEEDINVSQAVTREAPFKQARRWQGWDRV